MEKSCPWTGNEQIYIDYHDREWGVPVHDDRLLFEFLVLEGMQAGLSWITVLKKRENFRKAFDSFNAEKIACYNEKKVRELLQDPGIIRHRGKIASAVENAKLFLKIKKEYGSFDTFVWKLAGGKRKINYWKTIEEIPASTSEAEKMSGEFKKLGFSFVGPTICYAFMQAVGMVNDHITGCFRHKELK